MKKIMFVGMALLLGIGVQVFAAGDVQKGRDVRNQTIEFKANQYFQGTKTVITGELDLSGGTLNIPDGSVTNANLAPNSVSSSKIGNGEVDTSEIRDSAVTTVKMSLSGNLRIDAGSFIGNPDTETIADSADASKATLTLDTMYGTVKLVCNDDDGCDITMGESNATDGQVLRIVNSGATTVKMNDTSGVSELAGDFDPMGQWDSLILEYITDRWVELGRSDN